jgi:hypothetical protein
LVIAAVSSSEDARNGLQIHGAARPDRDLLPHLMAMMAAWAFQAQAVKQVVRHPACRA